MECVSYVIGGTRNRKYNITIIAKHMPGDYDIEYASPCQYLVV